MKKKYFIILLLILLLGCASTFKKDGNLASYNLTKPDLYWILPDTLREISGLTIIDSSTFICIQDENGILFTYDIDAGKIKSQYSFHIDGDYEGITKVGKSIFVLRSDGVLFEIEEYQNPKSKVNTFQTNIPANNNEGLCYDKSNNRLLIACKGKIGKGPEFKDRRVVYGFDLITKSLSEEPIYDFDIQSVKQFASYNRIDLPTKSRKFKGKVIKEPFIRFRTSALDIHPLTGHIYLLSAADYLLLVYDANGKLLFLEQLNPRIFNKAEGISFFENGDMLITNEGQDKQPSVLRFNFISSF